MFIVSIYNSCVKLDSDFLLLNADAVFDVDFNRFVAFHKQHGGLVTLFTHPNSHTQYIERKTLIEQQLDEKRVQLSRTSISKNVEQTLKSTRQIEKILDFGPPLTYFDEQIFTEMVKKISVSNTEVEFELINGMKLSEKRTEK